MSSPGRRLTLAASAWVFAALLAVRWAVLTVFSLKTTDEDQALLWYTTKELAHGAVHAPFLYGQRYASWLEALVAVPLYLAHVQLPVAVPVAATALNLAAWLFIACLARRRSAPLWALVFLAWATTLTLDYHEFASMPRGIFPGVFLAVAAAVALLRLPRPSRRSWALFAFLSVVAVAFNAGAVLIVVPVAIYVLDEARPSRPELLAGASGLGAGVVAYVLMQVPYFLRPAYSIHPAPSITASLHALASAHVGQVFSMYSFSFWRSSLGFAVVFALVAVVCIGSRARPVLFGFGVLTVLVVLLLANPKITDGRPNVFFPYARFFVALPFALCILVLLGSEHLALVPSRLGVIAAVLIATFASAAAVRDLPRQTDNVVRAAAHVSPVIPFSIPDVTRECSTLKRMATNNHAHVVVFLMKRTYAYACDALWSSDLVTLFPTYERRGWLMEAESRTKRTTAIIVSYAGFCPRVRLVAECRPTGEHGVEVISFPPQSLLEVLVAGGVRLTPRV